MDSAVFASVSNFIIGIRGNRVFQCSATTGAVLNQVDLGTYASGRGCLAYDVGTNKIFAAAWNTPSYALAGAAQVSNRNLYRINPATLAVELSVDIVSTFGLSSNNLCQQDAGICAMDSAGGRIYCRYFTCHTPLVGSGAGSLRFSAAAVGTFTLDNAGVLGGYPGLVYGLVGGHDNVIYTDQNGGPEVILYDYTSTTETTFSVASPKNMLAVGYAPNAGHVFVTDVLQSIYVYATNGAFITTINTGRASFNGLAVRYNATDGQIYVSGGNDNSVCVINPLTNSFQIITGFDCPVDIVFAGAVRMAIQAGAVPLKAF